MSGETTDLKALIEQALATEPTLRSDLLRDPSGTIAAISGAPLPEGFLIEVAEEDSVLRIRVTRDPDAPLTDDQLEAAAGGRGARLPGGPGWWFFDLNNNGVYDPGIDQIVREPPDYP